MEKIIWQGTQFNDAEFPANSASLGYQNSLEWRRVPKIWRHKAHLFASANSIEGSSWMAAVSSLAVKPGFIDNLFLIREVNEVGLYALRFYLNGEEKIVVVDDNLPVNHDR